jgi:hypothetical protein
LQLRYIRRITAFEMHFCMPRSKIYVNGNDRGGRPKPQLMEVEMKSFVVAVGFLVAAMSTALAQRYATDVHYDFGPGGFRPLHMF